MWAMDYTRTVGAVSLTMAYYYCAVGHSEVYSYYGGYTDDVQGIYSEKSVGGMVWSGIETM